jgi:peptidoglycan/xylan/chitin deacetylase (PgdA/CDA1 family)
MPRMGGQAGLRAPLRPLKTRYVTLPRYLLSGTSSLVEGFNTVGDWTFSLGSGSDDTTNTTEGGHGLALSTAASNTPTAKKSFGAISIAAYQDTYFLLHVYASAGAVGKSIGLWLANDITDLNPSFFQNSTAIDHIGWNTVGFTPTGWSAAGGMTWASTCNGFQIKLNGSASSQDVTLDNLIAGVVPIPAVLFTHDVGYDGAYSTLYRQLREKGLRGTAGVDTDSIGTAGRLTAAQLTALQAAGWCICHMTKDHTNLTTLSPDQAAVEAKISPATSALQGWGITEPAAHIIQYPNGAYDTATVLPACRAQSQVLGRILGNQASNWFPSGDLLTGLTIRAIASGSSASTVIGQIATALAARQTICLQVHQVDPDASSWPASSCQQVVNYLAAQKVPLLTLTDIYNLHQGSITVAVPW